jgi:putative IMPACT (imprinted ancient) family translation regulator
MTLPPPMCTYLTLAARGIAETRVLGSRFLALAFPVVEEAEARAELQARERELFDASHHCSAWRLHGGVWRANDAGEPSGSAGLPILAAIDGAGLEDCAVVVTRYFGGTKLGVGGLVRAYGDAASEALAAARRRRAIQALRCRARYPYEHTAGVMRALDRVAAGEMAHGFSPDGRGGEVEFTLPVAAEPILRELLRENSAGAVAPETLGTTTLYQDEPG